MSRIISLYNTEYLTLREFYVFPVFTALQAANYDYIQFNGSGLIMNSIIIQT